VNYDVDGPGDAYLIEVNDDQYLLNGKPSDEIYMIRSVDELLECERDEVQKMLKEAENYD
jgi:hypothetical protein